MNAVARLIGFVAVLAAIFAGAYAVGEVSGAGPNADRGEQSTMQGPGTDQHRQPGHTGPRQEDRE